MISLIYLASALFLGLALTRRLGFKLMIFERLAMAVALGLLLWTWLSFVACLLLPTALALVCTVFISLASGGLLWVSAPALEQKPLPGGKSAWYAWGLFSMLSTGLIGTLMWTHDLISRPDGLYSANATWADFGLHASLISHFAAQRQLTLDFPIAAGAHLTYPFMADMLSGWLLKGGLSIHDAIFIPAILLVAAFLQLMIGFGVRLFGHISGVLIGLSLTLACGPAVGAFVAWSDYRQSGLDLLGFLQALPQDYTALSQPNAQITNLIADAILPQRAFIMGFSSFGAILVIMLLLQRHRNITAASLTGCLIGLLPLVHAHTFIVLSALVAALWIESTIATKSIRHNWTYVVLFSTILAIPQIVWQLLGNSSGSGGHLSLLWNIQPGDNPYTFLANNYGFSGLLIILVSLVVLLEPSARRLRAWYLPFAVLFVVANIYSLQPFAYDNVKIIYYSYLMTYIFCGYAAVILARRYRHTLMPLIVLAFMLSGAGILAITREFEHQDQFASLDDLALAGWVKTSTLANDVFAATDRPNQPISALAGRPVVSGYRGWLYSYHLDYTPRLAAIQSALSGQLKQPNPYHAKYLAVATYEPPEWVVNRAALAATYQTAYSNQSWTIYVIPDR